MSISKIIIKKILKPTPKFFFLTISGIFLFWMTFIDEYSFISRIQNKATRSNLIELKAHIKDKIANDKERLNELQTDNENLEKFGREQFFLKKKNEDIYILLNED